jgi:hypothetical protein
LGDIVLTFTTELPPTRSPHELDFENHHHPSAPAYLVNTLVPADSAVHLPRPGYSADCYIAVADGSYRLTTTDQGALGMLNDLYRARDTGAAWAWVIDASGVFLTVLSVTGLGCCGI